MKGRTGFIVIDLSTKYNWYKNLATCFCEVCFFILLRLDKDRVDPVVAFTGDGSELLTS